MKLLELETLFNIKLIRDKEFFREWQDDLPGLSESEKQQLDKVQAGYFNLLRYPPFLENIVKMAVLDPLLFIGDFYLSPYCVKSEKSIEISALDEDTIIKGSLDVLVLKDQLWLMVIESKQAAFSIEAGLAQILAYMLANPYRDKPTFGIITTGGSFVFIKLVSGQQPQYATSKIFELRNPDNELYDVLKILKRYYSLNYLRTSKITFLCVLCVFVVKINTFTAQARCLCYSFMSVARFIFFRKQLSR